SRTRHTSSTRDWSSDVCSSDLMFTGSGGSRNRARHRRLDNRQVDQRRQHPEQDGKPPKRRVGSEFLERDTAEQNAEEAADLMAEIGRASCRESERTSRVGAAAE